MLENLRFMTSSDLSEVQRLLKNNQSKLKMQVKISENSCMTGKLLSHQEELQQLGELAGIHMDVKVFRVFVELLNMGVDPTTIFAVLKSIRRLLGRQSRSSLSQVSHS